MIIQGCVQYDFPHDDIWCSDCSNNAQQTRQANALEAHTVELRRANDLREEELILKTGLPPSRRRVKVTAPKETSASAHKGGTPPTTNTVKGGMDVRARRASTDT